MLSWKLEKQQTRLRRQAQIDTDSPTQNTSIIGIPKIGTFSHTHRVQPNRTNKLFHLPTAAATPNSQKTIKKTYTARQFHFMAVNRGDNALLEGEGPNSVRTKSLHDDIFAIDKTVENAAATREMLSNIDDHGDGASTGEAGEGCVFEH